MKITTLITTHPARLEQATTLARTVGGTLITDTKQYGAPWCHDTALAEGIRMHGDTDGWLVILEDDAIPCNDWHTQIEAALTVAPTKIVSLYLGTNYPRRRQAAIQTILDSTDTHWITHHELRHAVGYAIHSNIAPQLHRAVTRLHGEADKRLSIASQQLWQPIGYTCPSLVDHRDDTPLITHTPDGTARPRTKPRVAHRHGTRNQWTTDSVSLQ